MNDEYFKDEDLEETQEWLDAFDAVIKREGIEKAAHLLHQLSGRAVTSGIPIPFKDTTPYINTIPPEKSEKMPGNSLIARNVAGYVRWNAMAMVVKANKDFSGIGGHIASFASAAVLYEVGFDYFFKGPQAENGADLIYYQGHSSPGIYARAFVEGRLSEEELLHFRRESKTKGLSSYPHPWLMPHFWQFPTVSMGIGPINAIYQARFMKYMEARDFTKTGDRKVWAFIGDGETDEPETRGAISLAARENLDNLIFVINCNLQRLDGPVRGNGKIIQELEGVFRGAGWRVIKVIWGTEWDAVLKKDTRGVLLEKFNSMVDGEFQNLRTRDGAYIREHLFNKDPYLKELASEFSDRELWQMSRGGHDPRKVYAAYAEAVKTTGQPTVILMKTVKGYGMSKSGESANIAHNQKKMDEESIRNFRDRFHVPLADDELMKLPFIRPPKESKEYKFIHEQRKKLGGYLPDRTPGKASFKIPELSSFKTLLEGSHDKEMSSTMAFVRYLGSLLRDKEMGKFIVPIVPDEARTFGMEGLFRQIGIYSPVGQLYEPEDSDRFAWYKEDRKGQILEEGITEAGGISSWMAAASAYSNYNITMVPFFIFYSMFGFQRVGDFAWAAGDARCRGFLLGATAGRTTLNGEGLQHQDGHSHVIASTVPNCLTYDPAFAYEVVMIIQQGLKRMYVDEEDVFYYITLQNENYLHPAAPDHLTLEELSDQIEKGIYLYRKGGKKKKRVQLMGCGSILLQVIKAAEILEDEFQVSADIWSIPGINQLYKDGLECEHYNRYHPDAEQKTPYLTSVLKDQKGPAVLATDHIKAWPRLIQEQFPMSLTILGTDGFGRSDTREALRDFFEVDYRHILFSAIHALYKSGDIELEKVQDVIKKYDIDTEQEFQTTL